MLSRGATAGVAGVVIVELTTLAVAPVVTTAVALAETSNSFVSDVSTAMVPTVTAPEASRENEDTIFRFALYPVAVESVDRKF